MAVAMATFSRCALSPECKLHLISCDQLIMAVVLRLVRQLSG